MFRDRIAISPQHGTSSVFESWKGFSSGGQLHIYWTRCSGQPTRCSPPAWTWTKC